EGGLQPPNALRVGANNIAVEISDNGRENHKGGILRQERTWQPRPAKIVIHYIKEPLAVPAFIVEGDDIFGGSVGIVGQGGPPGVGLAAEHIGLSVIAGDPADHQPVGAGPAKRAPVVKASHLHLLGAEANWFPVSFGQLSYLLFHTRASFGPDVERGTVVLYYGYDVLLIGGRIGTEAADGYLLILQMGKHSLESFRLLIFGWAVAAPAFNVNRHIVNGGDGWLVAGPFFIRGGRIPFLGGDHLIIVVQIIGFSRLQLASPPQGSC